MIWFVIAIITFLIAAGALVYGFGAKSIGGVATGVGAVLLGGLFLFFATFYQNGVGEAKVVVNSVDRTVVRTIVTPSAGFKAPWEDFVEFDLFSQSLVYAGEPGHAPEYANGSVSGAEITVSVGGIAGGSTQGNVDATIVYNINPDAIEGIYNQYRSQERFTQMIVEKETLNTFRQIPAQFSAVEFRGTKRAEAVTDIQDGINAKLDSQGVEVTSVTIQDIRYSSQVEDALKAVEVANQQKQAAQAQAEAKVIAAKGDADAAVAAAKGEADANKLLNDSLTDKVLQSRYIDAISKSSTVYVTDGKTPIVLTK